MKGQLCKKILQLNKSVQEFFFPVKRIRALTYHQPQQEQVLHFIIYYMVVSSKSVRSIHY